MATSKTKKELLDDQVEAAQEEPPIDAVIIVKTTDPEGNINTHVVLNGSVQMTEVQTLIEIGLKGWRTQLGLGD